MVRKIGAVVAGILVVGVVVLGLQAVSAAFHPLPEGIDPMAAEDAEAFTAYLATMPVLSWAVACASELIGAFLGGLTAGWIARDRARVFSGALIGFALLASVNNWMSFEHPMWFIVGQLIGYPVALVGVWTILGRRESRQEAAEVGVGRGGSAEVT